MIRSGSGDVTGDCDDKETYVAKALAVVVVEKI
jgi:hypothetical protein